MRRLDTAPVCSAPPAARRGSRVRILDITKFYSAASGGVRTYLDSKIRAFQERGIDHALIIPGERDEQTVEGGTRVYRLAGPVITFSPHYRLLVSARAIERVLRIEQPDVIEVGSPFLVPWLVARAMRRAPVPTVGFYHSDLVRTFAEPLVPERAMAGLRVITRNAARSWVRTVYRRFDLTIAGSASVAADLRSLGVTNVRCVPLGVDLNVFAPDAREPPRLREALGIDDHRPIALYVGRFCAEKRLDVVVEAVTRLPDAERPHLLFVGGGPGKAWLEAMAAQLDHVSILPFVLDRLELATMYRNADFYIAAGPGETFGLAIAEAMACGLPVVAVNRGAAPDRVAGCPASELYRHGDAASCARAIQRIARKLSPEIRSAAARHSARVHSWDRTFDALIDLYEEVAGRGVRA